jgi:hypothetical protein
MACQFSITVMSAGAPEAASPTVAIKNFLPSAVTSHASAGPFGFGNRTCGIEALKPAVVFTATVIRTPFAGPRKKISFPSALQCGYAPPSFDTCHCPAAGVSPGPLDGVTGGANGRT